MPPSPSRLSTLQGNTSPSPLCPQDTFKSIAWMLLACLLFSVLGGFVKSSKTYFSLLEILFYRNLPTVFILGILMPILGSSLKTKFIFAQSRRATIGFIATVFNFLASTKLPLSLAMTLSYTNPIFLCLITVFWYKKRLHPGLISCIITGLVGIIVLLRPSGLSGTNWIFGFSGLAAGVFAALAYLNIQVLSQRGEPEWRTVFYFSLFSSLYAFGGTLLTQGYFHSLTFMHIKLILALGLTGLAGQLCITRAFSKSAATFTSVFSYSTPLFSTILGIIFFNEHLDLLSVIGGVIVVTSGIIVTLFKPKPLVIEN